MTVKLVWATPDAEKQIAYCARVSNPANQDNEDFAKLLRYCVKHQHWSVFEMANICMEINTTRDISRQILRHRSFQFQEFSGRYADMTLLGEPVWRECRLQDTKNRQNSVATDDEVLQAMFCNSQMKLWRLAQEHYKWALESGIAKEQARALLPEGLVPTRMYMNGTVRSWIHYINLRSDNGTQKEHRLIAQQCGQVLKEVCPTIYGAAIENLSNT